MENKIAVNDKNTIGPADDNEDGVDMSADQRSFDGEVIGTWDGIPLSVKCREYSNVLVSNN